MKVNLSMEMCRNLLSLFMTHDRINCSDISIINPYPDSSGWVQCTRCWLLTNIENGYCTEADFQLYATIRVSPHSTEDLIAEYSELINTCGIDDKKTKNFLKINNDNLEFKELAQIAENLKRNL